MERHNESSEDYLERILMLQEQGNDHVHAIDIASSMGYSKASVSIALRKLEDEGMVFVCPKQVLSLTEKGLAVASATYERHKIVGNLFVLLGVDPEVAYQDSCKIEHDISEETFQALKRKYLEMSAEEKK